jgi:hypothetical protein
MSRTIIVFGAASFGACFGYLTGAMMFMSKRGAA